MNTDKKFCKYCNREISWRKEVDKWVAYDGRMSSQKHNDYCFVGEPRFQKDDKIIAFWKNATIIYNVLAADKEAVTYIIEMPRNSRKRYGSKNFSFKVLERVAVPLNKIAALLYT